MEGVKGVRERESAVAEEEKEELNGKSVGS